MKEAPTIKITETARDAMQGWGRFIPTEDKVHYINQLLRVGFDTVDVGSFVSPKAVPQMADTGIVMSEFEKGDSASRIMVVIGNVKGCRMANRYEQIDLIGFPYSTSPTFLDRNIKSAPDQAWQELIEIKALADESGKKVRAYLSMAFGNPYGDPWSEEQILKEVGRLAAAGFHDIVFSDITGEGTAESIGQLCSRLISNFEGLDMGIHLHTKLEDWEPKIKAAWSAGFRNFEGALGGYGGCPMSGYELLGNMDTSNLQLFCDSLGIETGLDFSALSEAQKTARKIFV